VSESPSCVTAVVGFDFGVCFVEEVLSEVVLSNCTEAEAFLGDVFHELGFSSSDGD